MKGEKKMSKIISLDRAFELARDVASYFTKNYPDLFLDKIYHGREYLIELCKHLNAILITNKKLPGAKKRAAVMYVAGRPFILIDNSIKSDRTQLKMSLAHELGHVIMEHRKRFNFRTMGYSQPKNRNAEGLQDRYQSEIEFEATVASMFLLFPDGYLDKLIDDHVFIPSRHLANDLEVPFKWLVARVQIFRNMHGYEKSRKLLELQNKNQPGSSFVNIENHFAAIESTNRNYLVEFIPKPR